MIEGEGAAQILKFEGIDVAHFHFRSNLGWGKEDTGGRWESPYVERVEALFGVLGKLLVHHLGGWEATMRARRLTEWLGTIAKEARQFFIQNAKLVENARFREGFRGVFRKGVDKWEQQVWFAGETLKKEVQGRLPGLGDVGPLHLSKFSDLVIFFQTALMMFDFVEWSGGGLKRAQTRGGGPGRGGVHRGSFQRRLWRGARGCWRKQRREGEGG